VERTEATERGDAAAHDVYRAALGILSDAGVPFLVGGAYALAHYTGIERYTKDFDVFLLPDDRDRALRALHAEGYRVEVTFSHWLGKAYRDEYFLDIIYSSGNGVARVDAQWFEYAVPATVLGVPVRVIPAEEMIWSKAFIMERERYDGADVAHILRAHAEDLDWTRLVARFRDTWRVLFVHLMLFAFVYPAEQHRIPSRIIDDLVRLIEADLHTAAPPERLCCGTLLSREQYLPDVQRWGYLDARLSPRGALSRDETDRWTAAIGTT
jgi:hypothetical protein